MSIHPLRFTALAVALLALGASLSAQGFGPGPGRGRGPAAFEGRGLRGLNLTEAQKAQVKAIHERHQATLKARAEVAMSARTAMREAMGNPATDTKVLQGLHEKVSAAQFDLLLEHRALRQEILPILTPEQQAKFAKAPMGQGRQGRQDRQGRKGQRGPGMGQGLGQGLGPDCPLVTPS